MRLLITLLFVSFIVASACKKQKSDPVVSTEPADSSKTLTGPGNSLNPKWPAMATDPPPVTKDSFTTYLIKAGNNFCEKNTYQAGNWAILRFRAVLDSSCIYTTALPVNQLDINKLYGFADCSSFHHKNSARFGWNWVNGEMRIHAYCYADSVRKYKELGTVTVNKPFECKLTVLPDIYLFELNGKTDTMQRGCNTTTATGYKLLPYFGGDEPAPQDIRVKIQEY